MLKKHKDKIKVRKNKIKTNKYYRKYIDRDPSNFGVITAVYCKGCGAKIKGLNRDNQLATYSNYREITLGFDNGSRHMTPICRACMNTKNADDLEALYIADLDELELEDDGKDKKVWDIYLDRKPEKIHRED